MSFLHFLRYIAVVGLCTALSHADSIQLRSGRHLQGKFIGGTATGIEFMTHQTVEYFPTSDVLALMFDNNDASLGQLQPNSLDQDSLKYDLPALSRRTLRHVKANASVCTANLSPARKRTSVVKSD